MKFNNVYLLCRQAFHICQNHTLWVRQQKTMVVGYSSKPGPLTIVSRRYRQEGECSICGKIICRYVDKKVDPPEIVMQPENATDVPKWP